MAIEDVIAMPNNFNCRAEPCFSKRLSGAVLYVAMIMLILLALIGIVGMQVTGLQERMSSNYRASNLAFQNAENLLRARECGVEDKVNGTSTIGCSLSVTIDSCGETFDAGDWAADQAGETARVASTNIREIGVCMSGYSSIAMGGTEDESGHIPVYQITVYQTDDASNVTADAAVESIFRP
jgi:type IV pilus assembly protein PilX